MEFFLALIIGVTLGLMGSGGSILTVPILVYMTGYDPLLATTCSLFIVGVTAFAGTVNYAFKNEVNFKTGLFFVFPSILSVTVVRKYMLPHIPEILFSRWGIELHKSTFIMLVFAALMAVASYAMIRDRKEITRDQSDIKGFNRNVLVFLCGLAIGFLTGLVGAGGGFLIIPVLVLLLQIPIRQAIGTSLLIITVNSLVGFAAGMTSVELPWKFILYFTGFTIVGMFIGSLLATKISSERLKPVFGWFVAFMSIYVIIKELIGLG